jgi:WD40 repeat protein
VWDVQTGELLEPPSGAADHPACVAFSPDGGQVVVGGKSEVKIRKLRSLEPPSAGR